MFVSQDLNNLEFQTKIFENELVKISDLNFFLGDSPVKTIDKIVAPVDFQVQPQYHYQAVFTASEMSDEQKYKFASLFGCNFPQLQQNDQLILNWYEWAGSSADGYATVSAVFQRENNLEVKLAGIRKENADYLELLKTGQVSDEKLRLGLLLNGGERDLVHLQVPINLR